MYLKLLFLIAVVNSEYVDYTNYKVYKVTPKSEKDVEILLDLKSKHEYFFWSENLPIGRDVRIQVSPENQEEIENYFSEAGIEPVHVVDDVQKLIDEQSRRPTARSANIRDYAWDHYQNLDEINEWMDAIVEDHADVAKIITIGTTVEGRTIRGIEIDYSNRQSGKTYGFIEGGLHAREWISPPTVTWIIKEFLTSTDPGVRAMAEEITWHIFPVINPDGYVFTFNGDRAWRKNRNPAYLTSCAHVNLPDSASIGVDLNRNFDFQWNTFENNSDPCSLVFAGPTPFSEAESVAIANHIERLRATGQTIYYLGFHAHGEYVLLPHSHTGAEDLLTVPYFADLFEIATRGMDKLKVRYNTTYFVGTVTSLFVGRVGGLAFDWAKAVGNVPLSFIFESRDSGDFGFLLPPHNIIPNSEETLDGLVEMHKYAKRLGHIRTLPSNANSLTGNSIIVVLVAVILFNLIN